LLARELRPEQRIYCSPLVDPYQPAEAEARRMPQILEAVIAHPPRVFTLQTRGPLILRDLDLLRRIPSLRVSFSITTNREDVRKLFEPLCAPIAERLDVIRELRASGIEVYATLSPLLPCDPDELVRLVVDASGRDLIGDPLHVRSVKPRGATTRESAWNICGKNGFAEWLDAGFQDAIVEQIRGAAMRRGKCFQVGPRGFSRLAASTKT
jgi:DNA repair photolyase